MPEPQAEPPPAPPPAPLPPPTASKPVPVPLPPAPAALDGLFLADARVALVGCDNDLFCELRRLLCEGGATRHAALEAAITHIVVSIGHERCILWCVSPFL